MLISIPDCKPITRIPHRADFEAWKRGLSAAQYDAICDEITHRIEGHEVNTAGWIPGNNWEDTPFQAIYELACGFDQDASAGFFGLIVWDVLMRHPQTWSFGRYEKDGVPIQSMTYFRVDIR